MNVWYRIHARKIMFSYIYTDYFYREYNSRKQKQIEFHGEKMFNDTSVKEGLNLQDSNQLIIWDDFLAELDIPVDVEEIIEHDDLSLCWDDEKDFSIIANGLRIDLDEIDREYITAIRDHYTEFEPEVESLVNPLLKQFQRKDLEAIKKAIFMLGFTEWKVLGTDDKVIINEMIELAKRFGGSDVYKLVNGVFHELLIGENKE